MGFNLAFEGLKPFHLHALVHLNVSNFSRLLPLNSNKCWESQVSTKFFSVYSQTILRNQFWVAITNPISPLNNFYTYIQGRIYREADEASASGTLTYTDPFYQHCWQRDSPDSRDSRSGRRNGASRLTVLVVTIEQRRYSTVSHTLTHSHISSDKLTLSRSQELTGRRSKWILAFLPNF